MLELIILGLATWRISHMIVNEEGPYEIFDKLRYKVGVQYTEDLEPFGWNPIAEIFICVYCMSVWVGGVLFLFDALLGWSWIGIPFALSAFGIIVHEVIGRLQNV